MWYYCPCCCYCYKHYYYYYYYYVYRSVFIFQKRGNLSCCECLCVFLYMGESGKWKVIPLLFLNSIHFFFHFKVVFPPPFMSELCCQVAEAFLQYRSCQNKVGKEKKKKGFSTLKEKLKALNYTEHLPVSRPASVGAGRHCTA